MKKVLIFKMPEDQSEFNMANNGALYHSVLWDVDQKLRGYLKHGHKFENVDEALENIREYLRICMSENNCNFEE